jgi:hypothetical protein
VVVSDKIEDLDQLEAWLEDEDLRMSGAISGRASLRNLPNLMDVADRSFGQIHGTSLLLAGLRATLMSVVASSLSSQNMNKIQKVAASTRLFTRQAASSIRKFRPSTLTQNKAKHAEFSLIESTLSAAHSSIFTGQNDPHFSIHIAVVSGPSANIYSDARIGKNCYPHQIFNYPLSLNLKGKDHQLHAWETFEARPDPDGIWSFWRDWYQGLLTGKPLDWELQRRVALIEDAIWEAGPEAVAKEIASIQQAFKAIGHQENKPSSAQPVSAATAEAMAQLLQTNRDAISLTTASLLEQIAEFREKMRGNNHLESEFREEILAFLDQLSEKLRNLVEALPAVAETTDTRAGEKAVLWLRDFKAHFFKEAAAYSAPENIAKSAIPTGIILGCTAVGSLVGMPVAGTVVGGLIPGQLKPGKAADDLLKPKSSGGD